MLTPCIFGWTHRLRASQTMATRAFVQGTSSAFTRLPSIQMRVGLAPVACTFTADDHVEEVFYDGKNMKDVVKKRDQQFFLENTILYTGGNIKTDKVDHFKKLWQSDSLDVSDREVIWDWMDLFMRIAGSYHTSFGPICGWERNKEKIFF